MKTLLRIIVMVALTFFMLSLTTEAKDSANALNQIEKKISVDAQANEPALFEIQFRKVGI